MLISQNIGMSSVKSARDNKRSNSSVVYTCGGIVSLENCVTATTDNLIVNLFPSSSPPPPPRASTSKKENEQFCTDEEISGSKVLVGATHLDTFLIHEVLTDTSFKEFSSRQVNSVQLPSTLQNRCVVFRAKWVQVIPPPSCKGNLNGSQLQTSLLIICTNLAAFVYNELGTKQLFKFSWGSSSGSGVSNDDENESGSDSLGGSSKTIAATKDKILLGNDRGEIYLLSCHLKEKKGGSAINIVHSKTVKVFSEPVAEVCSRRNGLVVVGSSVGAVSVWTGFQGNEEPSKSMEFVLCKPEPVTGIQLWFPYAIVSYGSGIIRLFNLDEKVLTAKVFAHARWISSMDLCPCSNLLLSISEDDEARIWALRRRRQGEQRTPIKLHSSIQIDDVNFIGGRFFSQSGALILSNLGSKDLAVYVAASATQPVH